MNTALHSAAAIQTPPPLPSRSQASAHHAQPPARLPDLFEQSEQCSPHLLFERAFDSWMQKQDSDKAVRRSTSRNMYAAIWGAFSAWCVSQDLELQALTPADLERYIGERSKLLKPTRADRAAAAASSATANSSIAAAGGQRSFAPRYAWRLLTLIDHILQHHATTHHLPPNTCAQQVLRTKEEWRFANTPSFDRLPAYLEYDQAEDLICWLQATCGQHPHTESDGAQAPALPSAQTWIQARNRTSVALQLGSGLAPGEIRDLRLSDVLRCPTTGTALKLHVRAHSMSPAHEVPLAPWAVPLLENWIAIRQACGITASVLFPGTRGSNAWSKVSQFQAAQSTLLEAGIPEHALRGSFMLRHTFALRQVHAGVDSQRLAGWLGIVDLKRLRPYFSDISYGPARPV